MKINLWVMSLIAVSIGASLSTSTSFAEPRASDAVMTKIQNLLQGSLTGKNFHGEKCTVRAGLTWVSASLDEPSKYRDSRDFSLFDYQPRYVSYRITDTAEKLELYYYDGGSYDVRISDYNTVTLNLDHGSVTSITVLSNQAAHGNSGGAITCTISN